MVKSNISSVLNKLSLAYKKLPLGISQDELNMRRRSRYYEYLLYYSHFSTSNREADLSYR